jgi:HlyD family secretion protein
MKPAMKSIATILLALAVLSGRPAHGAQPSETTAGSPRAARPALVVSTVRPELTELGDVLVANGTIAPWQEAVIGAELAGVRIARLPVDVGDRVTRGQILAVLDDAQIRQDVAAAQAGLAEARAALAEAQIQANEAAANAERARKVEGSGAFSEQQLAQYRLADQAAQARVALAQARTQSAQAQVDTQQLRLQHTEVRAPDDGLITVRQALLGAVVSPGQELFRIIRGGRLEWRAEVIANELERLRPGQKVVLQLPGGAPVVGTLRRIAPQIDAASRNALVHVDLPVGVRARSGQFARGEIRVGASRALTVPQGAVVMRDGFAYVFRVQGERVAQIKIKPGRRSGERIEILEGVNAADALVAQGAAFLNDGDLVQVSSASK